MMETASSEDTHHERLAGDPDLLRSVSRLFLADYRQSVRRLREALAAEDRDSLYSAAHSLKGAAATLGSPAAVTAAQSIERCCRAGSLAAATREVDELAVAVEDLAARLRATLARLPD